MILFFLAGVFLGGRKGFPLLLINWLFMLCFSVVLGRDWMWSLYLLVDTTIYFLVGWFACGMFYSARGNYTWGEIIFICVNKITACVVSAACWLVIMRDSWFAGFNILLFRLVIWPLSSLSVIFLFLFFMRQDAGKFWLASVRKR
jgi:hypothetical protein